jgi:hypothetical protein
MRKKRPAAQLPDAFFLQGADADEAAEIIPM